jgi:hypothetical protein
MRPFSSKDHFLQSSADGLAASSEVRVNPQALAVFAQMMAEKQQGQEYKPMRWEKYISSEANAEPLDLARVLFEFALISAQNGGYLYCDAEGKTRKWEKNGSGADALLDKMAELRQAQKVPGIHLHHPDAVAQELAPLLKDVPYAQDRLKIFAEFAAPDALEACRAIAQHSIQTDGSVHFDYGTMLALAKLSPLGLGEDSFLKKAALTLLLTANHLMARGVPVTTDLPPAAEYRLFQTLEKAGVIEVSQPIAEAINRGLLFEEDDPRVKAMRDAVVVAVQGIKERSGLPDCTLDAALWFAGRKSTALEGLREDMVKRYADLFPGEKLGGGLTQTHFAAEGMRFRQPWRSLPSNHPGSHRRALRAGIIPHNQWEAGIKFRSLPNLFGLTGIEERATPPLGTIPAKSRPEPWGDRLLKERAESVAALG